MICVMATYQTARFHISRDRSLHLPHCDNLNPQTICQWYQPLDNPLIVLLYCSLVVALSLSSIVCVYSVVNFRLSFLVRQVTPRCWSFYLAANIRLLSLFLFCPGLLAECSSLPQDLVSCSSILPHTPSHYLFLCLPRWFISSSHLLPGHSLTAKAPALLSSYLHCLIAFIDQQYCFLLPFPFYVRPSRYISHNFSVCLHNFTLTSGYLLSAKVNEQHAVCTLQSKCHLQFPIPYTDSYADR